MSVSESEHRDSQPIQPNVSHTFSGKPKMRALLSSVPFWTYFLIIVLLGPLAAFYGAVGGWAAGAATLVIYSVPIFAAALSGDRRLTLVVVSVAAIVRIVESILVESPSTGWEFAFPLFILCVMFFASGAIVIVVEWLQGQIHLLTEENTQFARDIYRRDRQEKLDALTPKSKQIKLTTEVPESEKPKPTLQPRSKTSSINDTESVDFAMLLLAIQDVVRRISTNHDLESLVSTIVNTAKASLKCEVCDIYFWNANRRTLTNVVPQQLRNKKTLFVPCPDSGMAHWVLENRQILTRKDLETDFSLGSLLNEDAHQPEAIAPLTVGGELLGLLVIDEVEQQSPTFGRLLYILASNYALGIKNAQLFERIEQMARHDGLTGLLNHASFQEDLDELVRESASVGRPISVVMSDVDHFKNFNDTYGHQAGDHVLREVSKVFQAIMPNHAILARYGGEEFIAALPGEELSRAQEFAELMRENLESRIIDFEGQELAVRASFGVAQLGADITSSEDLIRVADVALYDAKGRGRNQVVCHTSPIKS
jgi:diguanylate cyclase (GGDEF)-like protein